MQRGRQRKYSWEEDSRFQPANDDHDEEWPRAEPVRATPRRASAKKARRPRKSPFMAALQGAGVALTVVIALGVGTMYLLDLGPSDLGLGQTSGNEARPRTKDLAAFQPEGAAPAQNEPIRQPVAVAPMPESQPAVPERVASAAPEPPPVAAAPETPAEAAQETPVAAPPQVAALPDPAPPPAPPKPEKLQISAAELDLLMTRARDAISQRDVSAARLLLARAARAEEPTAIVLLAQTYDPNMLVEWGNRGVKPDPERARALYRKAARLGVQEAGILLGRLE